MVVFENKYQYINIMQQYSFIKNKNSNNSIRNIVVSLFLVKPLAPQIYGLDGTLVGGQLYTLRCVSGYANPAATIKWYKDGVSWSADRVDISSFIGYYV